MVISNEFLTLNQSLFPILATQPRTPVRRTRLRSLLVSKLGRSNQMISGVREEASPSVALERSQDEISQAEQGAYQGRFLQRREKDYSLEVPLARSKTPGVQQGRSRRPATEYTECCCRAFQPRRRCRQSRVA